METPSSARAASLEAAWRPVSGLAAYERLGGAVIRLGVLGWPVSHSRSPAIHNAALHAVGLADGWHYQLLPVP